LPGTSYQIRNCAIYGNHAIFTSGNTPPAAFHFINRVNTNGDSCDVYANLFLDPMFADTSGDSLNVLAGSPCIDAGDSSLAREPDGSYADIGAVPFLHLDRWNAIYFANGFNGIGCPCEFPLQLQEGSLVRLRRDETANGQSPDDPIVSEFAVTAGAGLPPWNGYWEPRPDSILAVDTFYVELLAGACCWISGDLQFTDRDTATVLADGWSCSNTCTHSNTIAHPQPLSDTPITAAVGGFGIAPNPFNAQTNIQFSLATKQFVTLTLFDMTGRRVKELARGEYDSGIHRVTFDGTNLATGIYFVRLNSATQITTQKLLLLK
jgi:hypothetical protein